MKHIAQSLDYSPVAALFVRSNSHYKAMPGVDAFDFERNALNFSGGVPGVYHPPCRSWGQLAHMAKPVPGERELAIWSMDMVRKHGGVVEHPYCSRLWAVTACGSFGVRDQFGGVLIPVFQSWWGHRAQKRTCFYIVGPVPEIPFSEKPHTHLVERMCRAEREATPPELATWLINTARACA